MQLKESRLFTGLHHKRGTLEELGVLGAFKVADIEIAIVVPIRPENDLHIFWKSDVLGLALGVTLVFAGGWGNLGID